MVIKIEVSEDRNIISKALKSSKVIESFEYTPSVTCQKFMVSESRRRALIGPIGSGKTTAAAVDLFRRACLVPPDASGVRKSKVFVLAKGYRESVLLSVKELFPSVVWSWSEKDNCLTFKFNDVESHWLFSEYVDVYGDYTWIWVDNAREFSTSSIRDLEGRVGRYPRAVKDYGLILTSLAPCRDDCSGYEFRQLLNGSGTDLYVQPSGLSLEAENTENLTPGYYQRISQGRSQEWLDVCIHAKI